MIWGFNPKKNWYFSLVDLDVLDLVITYYGVREENGARSRGRASPRVRRDRDPRGPTRADRVHDARLAWNAREVRGVWQRPEQFLRSQHSCTKST